MSVEVVGESDNREEWLERRKGYLGASSIFTWREVDHPQWWSDKRKDIIMEKFDGVEKTFDNDAQVSINHGAFSEQDIARKFGDGIGCEVETTNKMFVNDRWPHLAATIDGFVHPPEQGSKLGPQYCQDPDVFPRLRTALRLADRTHVLELKRSVSVAWQKYVPDYYLAQVQTQLTVMEVDAAVICADTLCRVGRRTFWDMRPYRIEKQFGWEIVLDQCEEEFLTVLNAHGKLEK